MAKSSRDVFKDSLDKAFASIKPNSGTMTDYMKYSQSMKENESEDSTPMIKKTIHRVLKTKKKEAKEATGTGSSGAYSAPLFSGEEPQFKSETKESDKDFGKSAKHQFRQELQTDPDYLDFKKKAKYMAHGSEFSYGVPNVSIDDPYVEKRKYSRVGKTKGSGTKNEFTPPVFDGDDEFWENSKLESKELDEQVEKVEAKEATGSGSVGGYSTPAMWAKSTKKKDWGPSRKTQIPGGGFVKVKKKCTKFPYCNQGDINSVKITKNESVKNAIKNVSKKIGISETVIKNILERQYKKINKTNK